MQVRKGYTLIFGLALVATIALLLAGCNNAPVQETQPGASADAGAAMTGNAAAQPSSAALENESSVDDVDAYMNDINLDDW